MLADSMKALPDQLMLFLLQVLHFILACLNRLGAPVLVCAYPTHLAVDRRISRSDSLSLQDEAVLNDHDFETPTERSARVSNETHSSDRRDDALRGRTGARKTRMVRNNQEEEGSNNTERRRKSSRREQEGGFNFEPMGHV